MDGSSNRSEVEPDVQLPSTIKRVTTPMITVIPARSADRVSVGRCDSNPVFSGCSLNFFTSSSFEHDYDLPKIMSAIARSSRALRVAARSATVSAKAPSRAYSLLAKTAVAATPSVSASQVRHVL